MPSDHVQVAILGAGVSGLAAGYKLQKKGIDFRIFEATDMIGGVIRTVEKDGFRYEKGPNSMVATAPLLDLISELGLSEVIQRATAESNRRYILWGGTLHELAPSPKSILKTKLLSASGKIGVLKDLINSKKWKKDETVHAFFTRHFGEQIARRIVSAMINGIYAGDAELLEMESVFPRLIEMERQHGSIIKGMIRAGKEGGSKREIISFEGGMQTLMHAFTKGFDDHLELNSRVEKVTPKIEGGFEIEYQQEGKSYWLSADHVISTIPASPLALAFNFENTKLGDRLNQIKYNPMLLFHLSFPSEDLKGRADGFGFLAPHDEESEFIGVMWNSNTFSNLAREGSAMCTFFVRPKDVDISSEKVKHLLSTLCLPKFEKWTGITSKPRFIDYTFWSKAIPQKTVGHAQLVSDVGAFEKTCPGLHISGNFISGVSVGDCIEYNVKLVERLFGR